MKSLLNPVAAIVGIVGVAVFTFMVLRVFSLTMQVSTTGAIATPTTEVQTAPTSTAQWNVNRVEIVSVGEVSSSSELVANRGAQLLDPKFSPERISYLKQKATGQYDLEWIDVKTQTAATLVAAVVNENDVWLVSLTGDQSKVQLVPPADYLQYSNLIHGLRWSSGGNYLAMIASDDSILVYDRKGRLQRQLVTDGERITSMAWSPDEQSIAVITDARTEGRTRYAVNLLGVFDAVKTNVFTSPIRKQTLDWSPPGQFIAVGQDDQQLPILAEIKSC